MEPSTVITIVSSLIGIAASAVLTVFNRVRSDPVFQYSTDKFIVGDRARTILILWNKGPYPLRDHEIAPRDPIRISFPCRIESCQVSKPSNNASGATLSTTDKCNVLRLNFDYLNRDDGIAACVIHRDVGKPPSISGSIIGQKIGFRDLGSVRPSKMPHAYPKAIQKQRNRRTVVLSVTTLVWIGVLIGSIFLDIIPFSNDNTSVLVSYILGIQGGIWLPRMIHYLWRSRKKWPKELNEFIEQN